MSGLTSCLLSLLQPKIERLTGPVGAMMVDLQRSAERIDGKESVGASIVKARFCRRMTIGGKGK